MNAGRHAVVRNDNGQYAIWPGDLTVPGGWYLIHGPSTREDCRAYVEREWRPPSLGFPGDPRHGRSPAGFADTVHGLFRTRAAHDPEAAAVIDDGVTLSYRELDRRSDRLADALRAAGAGPDHVVPVCLERGAALVVAWLGVLKAGGAFLPLDPAYPVRRIDQLVEDCGAQVAVTDGRALPGVRNLRPDAGPPDPVAPAGTPDSRPDDLAYLIYTSGTTGVPKGVAVTHRSLVFTLDRVVRAYGLAPGDRVLQLAALGFDTSLEQVFATLLAGATLVLGGGRTWAPTELVHRMDGVGLTVADLTPAYWHHVLALLPPAVPPAPAPDPPDGAGGTPPGATRPAPTGATPDTAGSDTAGSDTAGSDTARPAGGTIGGTTPPGPGRDGLRLVVVGGDVVHADDCRACLERLPGVRLVNAYGVTEAAITSALCEITPDLLATAGAAGAAAPMPIGRPLPGVRVHVLDARLRPVRPGEKGEIHLGGPGLARGYWRAPVLTAESFLPDPYAPVPGERMYRTGDAGRWRSDGQLEILGRLDDQVKVRGNRVDPAEIEAALAAHPDVRQARVAADSGAPDGSRALTAYYTLADRASTGARARRDRIRAYLAERLPEYMVPAEFVLLDSMPLTAAGKIDRRLLPRSEPKVHRRDGERRTPARTQDRVGSAPGAGAVEAAIGHLWTELLGVEDVGPADDFFALGGNSLLAMEMLARARIMLGIDVTRIRALTRALLRDATLRAFATAVQAARADGSGTREAALDWAAEAQLPYPVKQSWSPAPCRADPAEILLTGATGFCGAHLLHALLATTRARIHCLVRAPDEEHGLERLRASQQRFLRHDLADTRVLPLVGDLAEPRLGLTERQFAWLAGNVDAIHHLGGQVNFIYPYHQLHAPNVGGTREIVRLAGHSRGIPVHYLSTLAVLAGFGAAGVDEVTERTPLAHADKLGVGYVESKWVSEQLLHNAAAAGLPVTVLRTNDVTGDLASGVMNTGTEICALIKYLADSGTCPDVRLLLDFVPADRFGQAVAHIAAHAPANGEVYHLTSPRPAVLADLADRLRARGHPIAELPYGEWVQGLVRFAAGHPTHPITPFVPLFVDRSPGTDLSISEMYFRPTFPLFDRANTDEALTGSGIELPAVDADLLDLYLRQLAAEGFLAAPAGALRG
ncbi:thioester reductase domain-containing protein [Kitasatospora sp. NPDC004745]|uniref:thioester reductase domain-containing protein n=1 Tax=Kitasatospora sp. NPDC004745 TaxID=3364019 RepID=UPI003683179B